VAGSPEALLDPLLGESVTRADLIPGDAGLAGGPNLGDLQLLGRFAQAPGSFEAANRFVGDDEGAKRHCDPPDETLGGHYHRVSTISTGQRYVDVSGQQIVDLVRVGKRVIRVAKKSKKDKKSKKSKKSKK
jgi:hypothetical protein